jgi:dTDP-4-dehydrorhamnose reductase
MCADQTFLVFGGKTGWIGQKIVALLRQEQHQVFEAKSRLEQREAVTQEIEQVKPDCVINAAGITGMPNVDWCEDHKQETIRANLIGALNLADITYLQGIHMINLGTGCIYEYDEEHPMYSDKGFTEEDEPNFHGSFYSHTKCMLDNLLKCYPNVLNLRLRMPISSDLHPRSFVTKITRYQKVVNIPNSMSILDDLLPLIPKMAERRLIGTYNFVNPGVISHNEILDLYTQYVNSTFRYVNFSIEEQNKILKAKRSNNYLDATKLQKEFPELKNIKESIVGVFKKMQKGIVC